MPPRKSLPSSPSGSGRTSTHTSTSPRVRLLFLKRCCDLTQDYSAVNPTYFYGPFTPLFPVRVFPAETRYVDVRDAAQAHVRALSAPPTAAVGRKRIVFSAPTGWPFQRTLDFIAEQRPALKARLITAAPKALPADVLPMDFGRVEEVLGMKIADFHTTEQVRFRVPFMRCFLLIFRQRSTPS